MSRLSAVTREEGFPTRAEMVARYEERSGRSMRDLRWYLTLATWKSVVFMEGRTFVFEVQYVTACCELGHTCHCVYGLRSSVADYRNVSCP